MIKRCLSLALTVTHNAKTDPFLRLWVYIRDAPAAAKKEGRSMLGMFDLSDTYVHGGAPRRAPVKAYT